MKEPQSGIFVVLSALTTNITVLWDVTPRILVTLTDISEKHAPTIFYPEHRGSKFLRNISRHLPEPTALHARTSGTTGRNSAEVGTVCHQKTNLVNKIVQCVPAHGI
jgi:hypothetical protein